MVFCNDKSDSIAVYDTDVTILILIDGFLQYDVTIEDEIDLFKSQSLF